MGFWGFLALGLGLWIVLGLILLAWGVGWRHALHWLLPWWRRGNPEDYSRQADRWVCARGETIEVILRHTPPMQIALARDHDVLLALDHSGSMGSMAGSPLREAIRAAESFVRRVPANVHVGIVAFDHEARLLCPFTEDQRAVLRALGAIGPGGGTELHLALERCITALDDGRSQIPKTVIVLSDGGSDPTLAHVAASKLRDHPTQPTIVCAGFGAHAADELLAEIAGERGQMIHVQSTDDLHGLFMTLAGAVTGQEPVAGLIDEGVQAPRPFILTGTGSPYPIAVAPAQSTRITWSAPVMSNDLRPVSYRVEAACVGWWPLATPDAVVRWRMPDGTEHTIAGPRTPSILVLPHGWRWTWPILHPLVWLILQRFLRCQTTREISPPWNVALLPFPTCPEPLPAPAAERFLPSLRRALIIGMGVPGEDVLCRLKHRLWDRGVVGDAVEYVALQLGHPENRPPVEFGTFRLHASERVILHADLRPYVETLREESAPATRNWIPVHQWLAHTQPLITISGARGDRRLARLALLRDPVSLEARIQATVHRLQKDDGLVLLVGAADDAECSGMLSEVAHICATHGLRVTAVLLPALRNAAQDHSTLGLVDELERMLSRRGDWLVSDRQEPPVEAQRLFDRVLLAGDEHATLQDNCGVLADVIWALLSVPAVLEQMRENDCYRVHYRGLFAPLDSLWEWVRARSLMEAVNQQWLGLQSHDTGFIVPPADERLARQYADLFWTGTGYTRPRSALFDGAVAVLYQNQPVTSLLGEEESFPSTKPYHEQQAFCLLQRRQFAVYTEEWCAMTLQALQETAIWPIPVLAQALQIITADFERLSVRLRTLSGNSDFANLTGFIAGLYSEYRTVLQPLNTSLAAWQACLTGHVASGPSSAEQSDIPPVCLAIQRGYERAAERVQFPTTAARDDAEAQYRSWSASYGQVLRSQLRYRVRCDPPDSHLGLDVYLSDKRLTPQDDIVAALRHFLDRYAPTVWSWPQERWLVTATPNAVSREAFGIGHHAHAAFPSVQRVENERDVYAAVAMTLTPQPLREAFQLSTFHSPQAVYVWPEEANAARIADKIRYALDRDPEPFTPQVIAFMRDTTRLYTFFADIAHGCLTLQNGRALLQRAGRTFAVGPARLDLEGLERFEDIVQQVVARGVCLEGQPLPLEPAMWSIAPEAAVRLIEAHPLVIDAARSPYWTMWQDVIRGLVLEHGQPVHA